MKNYKLTDLEKAHGFAEDLKWCVSRDLKHSLGFIEAALAVEGSLTWKLDITSASSIHSRPTVRASLSNWEGVVFWDYSGIYYSQIALDQHFLPGYEPLAALVNAYIFAMLNIKAEYQQMRTYDPLLVAEKLAYDQKAVIDSVIGEK